MSPQTKSLAKEGYITKRLRQIEEGVLGMNVKVQQLGKYRHQCRSMYELLQKYVQAGCQICLDGKEARPDRIATICFRDGCSYMMDFIPDTDNPGQIACIDFTKIRDEDNGSHLRRDNNANYSHANVSRYEGWCS